MRKMSKNKLFDYAFFTARNCAAFLYVVLAVACTNKSDRAKAAKENETPNAGNIDVSLLQGTWWREETDSAAVFEIRGDSLYYTDEQHAPYFVSIRDNT